jgi:hypothetical protein
MPSPLVVTDSLNNPVDIHLLYDPWYTLDLWVDKSGNIIKGSARRATRSDKELSKRIIDAYEERAGDMMRSIPSDCARKKEILEQALDEDQRLRRENQIKSEADILNQSRVISLIEQCGFPKESEVGSKGMQAVFLIVQHSNRRTREKYFPALKEVLDPKDAALLEDRILLESGERQKYGTQIIFNDETNTYEVRAIDDPARVNERRKMVGLEPIEEYLKQWSIKFTN